MLRKIWHFCSADVKRVENILHFLRGVAKFRQIFIKIKDKDGNVCWKNVLENAKSFKNKISLKNFGRLCLLFFSGRSGAEVCKSCRSCQELSRVCSFKNRLRYSRERASRSLEVISFIYSFASSPGRTSMHAGFIATAAASIQPGKNRLKAVVRGRSQENC